MSMFKIIILTAFFFANVIAACISPISTILNRCSIARMTSCFIKTTDGVTSYLTFSLVGKQ